ncbi:TonB-dependent receptor [Permianibacter sp. IMCC34836]|uniref:TonB-dependent receptor domain-containing protein n=1 Tax=Permianibacter fluminis TaxID=2738515 RepID=UPI001554C517|nr:TonB-dependent receptor [Permianibacter fluminis]NQD36353.1 TonB-dependent receptor [Permianibacter fluminis]
MVASTQTLNRVTQAIGWALALIHLPASAQDADTEKEPEAERVVVTGSLIRRAEFKGEQPVEIISAEQAAAQGVSNVGELLRRITVASGSPQVTAALGVDFVNSGGEGVETIGLRGLGANRTLVLLNGRRAGPAGTRGGTSSFDFNVLPIAAIDRVEILKDGASSLYGSDAIAGVINIITKKGDGGEVNVYVSQPEQSGGEENRFSATWGASSENGSFRIVADYNKQFELARGQRDFASCSRRNLFDPNSGARRDPIDPRTGRAHCLDWRWGHVWIYDYQDPDNPDGNYRDFQLMQYDYDGSLAQFAPDGSVMPNVYDPLNPDRIVTPAGWYAVNYDRETDALTNADHPFQNAQSLVPESERTTIYGQGDLQLTDSVTLYSEVLLNRRKSYTNSYAQFWGYVYNETHSFDEDGNMVEQGGNPLSAGWAGAQWLSPTAITDHFDSSTKVDYLRAVVGLNGELNDWYWDVSYQFSRSDGDYSNDEIYGDSIWDQNWGFGSCAGNPTSTRGVDCIDIPWLDPEFLRGNISPELRKFLFGRQTGNTLYEQHAFDAVITGDLFSLPAGTVAVATGIHYQTDKINDTPGDIWLQQNSWHGWSAGITKGEDTTTAAFAEFKLPLLADLPGVEYLELSLSGRYTDVDSSGSANTYKSSLSWQIGAGVSVRASYGTSFRAPALFELYLADEVSFASQRDIDPCIDWGAALANGDISQRIADNCAADGLPNDFGGGAITATVYTGGGLGQLKPETAKATTYGVVWNADFAELAISLDYFDFKVEDEVTILGAQNIVRQCYDSLNFPTDPLCDLFDRATPESGEEPVDYRIEPVSDRYINIAQQIYRGYDFAIDYHTEIPFGTLILQTRHTFQEEETQQLFAGAEEDFKGEYGHPDHTATFNATVEVGNWLVDWGVQYFGPVSNKRRLGGDVVDYRGDDVRIVVGNDGIYYHSLSTSYQPEDKRWEMTVGIANLTDKEPPTVSTYRSELRSIGDAAAYSQYDLFGRRFFADFTYRF